MRSTSDPCGVGHESLRWKGSVLFRGLSARHRKTLAGDEKHPEAKTPGQRLFPGVPPGHRSGVKPTANPLVVSSSLTPGATKPPGSRGFLCCGLTDGSSSGPNGGRIRSGCPSVLLVQPVGEILQILGVEVSVPVGASRRSSSASQRSNRTPRLPPAPRGPIRPDPGHPRATPSRGAPPRRVSGGRAACRSATVI